MIVKPKALKAGATLAIVSPASVVKPELVVAGCAALEGLGYRCIVSPHALDRGPLNYAGTLQDRLADLHAAFADPTIDGIVCSRGGWGSAELLPLLDKSLVRANPKPFMGYSDLTSIHLWLRHEIGLVSFQAPMVASDFAKGIGPDLASWYAALAGDGTWELNASHGLRVLRPGLAEGELSGGCLSIYAEAIGTAWAPQPRGGVLFLEDVGTHAYQWDRMLLHLRYAGLLDGVEGIVFGDMGQCARPEEQEAIEASLLYSLRDFTGPIAIGLRSGHVDSGNITLPFGVRVSLDLNTAGNPRMHFLESSVEA